MLKIYNSLTQTKAPFTPLKPGHIGLYVCGVTVYDNCHIGHARSTILFDIIVRYLRARGYDVTHVRNITDIDDKIIRRAKENNEHWEALTARFIASMHNDDRALGVAPPTHEPRATDYIPQIIALVERLLEHGYAYVTKSGDVCFDVRKFEDYGKLSHRDLEKLIAGARIEINSDKKDPLDFVLWKLSKPDEPKWPSPWGEGRPGWHIECSAMSSELLGQPFDIHGGGMDLKFPHHENEIAQSEAGMGCEFVNTWMHIGLLQVNKEKMSKSLGNFFTIKEVLAEHHREVIRYFMISGHYRSPVNYSKDTLHQVQQSLASLYRAVRGLPSVEAPDDHPMAEQFYAAMDDDFNTPQALSVLFDLAHEVNRLKETGQITEAAPLASLLFKLGDIFGILQEDPERFLQGDINADLTAEIAGLIAERNAARAAKDWQKADEVRDQLSEMGIVIEDGPDGTTWRKASSI